MTESSSPNLLLKRIFGDETREIPSLGWWLPASMAAWLVLPVLFAIVTVNAESLIYTWSIGGLIWTAWFVNFQMGTGWQRLARSLGFSYVAKANEGNIKAMPALALWSEDNVGWMGPLIGGYWEGMESLVFTWRLAAREGIDNGTTVALVSMMSKRLSNFCLKPRAWDLAAADLVEPWEQAWNDTFRKCYRIEGDMGDDLKMQFSSRIMAYFAQHPTWTVESCDGWLALYRVGQTLEPDQVEFRLDKAVEILRLFMDNAADNSKSVEIRADDRG